MPWQTTAAASLTHLRNLGLRTWLGQASDTDRLPDLEARGPPERIIFGTGEPGSERPINRIIRRYFGRPRRWASSLATLTLGKCNMRPNAVINYKA
jgi:hypothetical protein